MAYWINFELMEELKHFLNKMVLLILFHLNIKQFVHVSSDLHSNSQKLPYKPWGHLHENEAPAIEHSPLFLQIFCLGQGIGSCILEIITSSSI